MERYWEWLCSIPGLYRPQQALLLRRFHTPKGVWEASGAVFEQTEWQGCPWISRVEEFRRRMTPEDTVHMHREAGIQFTSEEHTMYPERLRTIADRPYGLFYRGGLPEQSGKCVAIVGARLCTPRGKEMAERLAQCVSGAGGQVISGAAYGIDGAAQWAAVRSGGSSYAVLGCGVDRFYPAAHRELLDCLAQSGGVISELPPGTPPLRAHFPVRNRIISGLADVVVVVEARAKSGSLITADFAAEQGRDVMAVPGRPGDELSEGCNTLISQGAGLILSADSFLREIFPEYRMRGNQLSGNLALAPAEKLVYISLDFYAKSLWELEERTALPPADLSSSLLALEMKGLIKETERGYYARTQ